MPVYPVICAPVECTYLHRKRIEKNWVFFERAGELFAYYSIDPLIVIKSHTMDITGGLKNLQFERISEAEKRSKSHYSIGTQVLMEGNTHYLVAHKKIFFGKKRMYLGRVVRITYDVNMKPDVQFLNTYLIHSLKSLWGASVRHNKNLWSCTYFSGFMSTPKSFVLGYGINDLTYGFAEIPKAKALA
jgi:hypothetical protein